MARTPLGGATLQLPRFAIHVDAPGAERRTLVIDEQGADARVFVGSSESCQVVVADPLVSRRHLALALEPGHLRLTDLDSTNGTQVGGIDVVEARLFGGETIRVGDTKIVVERLADDRAVSVPAARGFGRLMGESPEMRRLYPLMGRLAMSDVPVIIEGETGTGKELLAEAIHEASPRAAGPYVVFDCTIGPSSLLESALFGHERGAFTNALVSKPGVFEQANGGTLLIDEIGDLDVALQAKLLRALQRREVQRLGSNKWIKVDVRIMAATRRDLEKEIQAGRFRDDLYYRLAVARIELPPLRRRTGDVAVLARHFWTQLGGVGPIPQAFLERLAMYLWPVRELHNAVAHEVALGDLGDTEGLRRSVPPPGSQHGPAGGDVLDAIVAEDLPYMRARDKALAAFDERYVKAVLAKHGGNVTKAAAASGVARRYFYVIKSRSAKE